MKEIRILVIDDQYGSREGLRDAFLEQVGALTSDNKKVINYPYHFIFHSGQDGNKNNSLPAIEAEIKKYWPANEGGEWALILLDVRFDQRIQGDEDENFGFRVLAYLRETFGSDLPVVMLTSEDETKRSKANIAAADGYLPKNLLNRETLERCVTAHGLIPDTRSGEHRLIGKTLPLLKILREARRYALKPIGSRILYGETGSGKTELARYIHDFTGRRGAFRSWTVVPSGDANFTRDKLFGHWKDAHAGARSSMPGEIESAHEGTFLLDEIADLSPDAQQLLIEFRRRDSAGLRTLSRFGSFPIPDQGGQAARSVIGRLQTDHKIKVDVLFLSATNQNLRDKVLRKTKGFRDDLFNDLGQSLDFPGLNERREDIADILQWIVASIRPERTKISTEVIDLLRNRDWKNRNIVDLKSIIEVSISNLGDFNEILPRHLPEQVKNDGNRSNTSGVFRNVVGEAMAQTHIVENDREIASPVGIKENRTVSLKDLPELLRNIEIPGKKEELDGILNKLHGEYQHLLISVLRNALEDTMDRQPGKLEGEIRPTTAIKWLLGKRDNGSKEGKAKTGISAYEAADVIKRIIKKIDQPSKDIDIQNQLVMEAVKWAKNLRQNPPKNSNNQKKASKGKG